MWVTASATGPMKMPISPKAISPPITPTKISTSGRSAAPILIRIGRSTLSMVATTSITTSRKVPMPGAGPVQPEHRRGDHQRGTDLGHGGQEHDQRQHRRERMPAIASPMPPTMVWAMR